MLCYINLYLNPVERTQYFNIFKLKSIVKQFIAICLIRKFGVFKQKPPQSMG